MAKGQRLHALDKPEMQDQLAELQRFRRQARLAHLENRQQQAIDADYYDGIQLTDDQLAVLEERNQPIQIWNITKGVINWALGVEEKTRLDMNCLPRKKVDERDAKTKTKLLKYNADLNYAEYQNSLAFSDAAKVGVGWLDIGAKNNPAAPLYRNRVSWRDVWFDNLGIKADLSDWRYLFLERWIDLDIATSIFEDREKELQGVAQDTNSRYPYNPEDAYVFDDATDGVSTDYGMTFGQTIEGYRSRVKIVHMQYRKPDKVKILNVSGREYGASDGVIYRPGDEFHDHLVKYGYADLGDARRMTVRHALFCGNTYLMDYASPYNHNQFSLVPIFCYRRDRDGMPYGMIRDLRSPQDDVNARKARAYFLMSTEKMLVEEGALVGSIEHARDEYNRPDGVVLFAKGALAGNKFRSENGLQAAQQHLAVGREAEQFMHNISGVTPEVQGQSKRDLSGVAIERLQTQGATGNAGLFMNYYFALQLGGEIELSNIEQFYDREMEIRITGEEQRHEFLTINGKNGQGEAVDSITRAKSDFKIVKADYRETVRQAQQDTMLGLITNLLKTGGQKAGELALCMIDVYVDLYDNLPGKEELLARIRKITGQEALDEDATPEEKQRKLQQLQAKQAEMQKQKALQERGVQLALDEKAAKIEATHAKALKDRVEALLKQIEAFTSSMETAGTVAVAPELVEGADTIIEEARAATEPGQQRQLAPAQGGMSNGQG